MGLTSKVGSFALPFVIAEEKGLFRSEGLNAVVVMMQNQVVVNGVLSKNLDYANALGAPFVILVGRRELADGKVKLKDMRSGEETLLSPDDLVTALPGRIADGR